MPANVIAIDGPSYVGKSTIARELGRLTGYTFINTGHMYRAVGRACLTERVDLRDEESVLGRARKLTIDFQSKADGVRTIIDGQDCTEDLAGENIVRAASQLSSFPKLRELLTAQQRNFSKKKTIIMEGRDIGSTVFPDARWKFFVTASLLIRAWRMYKTLPEEEKKRYSGHAELIPKIEALDRVDLNRPVAPLRQADDAIVYDNTDSPSEKEDAEYLRGYLDR